ncbi:MAG: hypothetical protein IAF02_19330 [Anaerolineae bacterium]|nr:hypothetical protein [Anaerolineae bacterium]
MKKRVLILVGTLGIGFLGMVMLMSVTAESLPETSSVNIPTQGSFPLPEPRGIYINRRTDGLENAFNQAIFGPKSCTAFGDPYSPLNSSWARGSYTYKYRILIPPTYSSDIVRIELFDPDSINNAVTSTIFTHSDIAIDNQFPITGTASCKDDRRNPCVVSTGETDLLEDGLGLSYDQINPFWMIRIDENRGSGSGDGDGQCNIPVTYTPRYNTQTRYDLSYKIRNEEGVPQSIKLASYTGQSGDGIRDNGNHYTDMHWVSPGAATSFDQPVFVPTDANSPGTFEVDLTEDVPGIIVNPLTGNRELYLNVTAVSGASENGFDIWAGPPNYINSVPSEVNARNLHIINNPQSHSSNGITVFSLETLPQNSSIKTRLALPITYLEPQYAGQVISITAFDIDNTTRSPIVFYMDTIPQSDWSLSFGNTGTIDPDGIPADNRCLPGLCNDEWIEPAYQIQLPDFTEECDVSAPDPQKCVPFLGGRLMASFIGGQHDTYAWEIELPPEPIVDNTGTCSVFPIALNEGSYSVSPPGNGSNEYPDSSEFDYPAVPPSYHSFISHVPNVSLTHASEGQVFRLYDGKETGDFGWLKWNAGRPDNDLTLRNSLTRPGNSTDYKDHGYTDLYPASPLFSWIVDGYVNPNDTSDISLNKGDWILGKSNAITTTLPQVRLMSHIDNKRTLRLPIWNESDNDAYRMAGVAAFRLVGYHIDSTAGASWLLLEFVKWDTSCGQEFVDIQNLSLSGAKKGHVNTAYTFFANVQPVTTTNPISYTWEADGQPLIVQENTFLDEVTYSWPDPGVKLITVTAQNKGAITVQALYSIELNLRTVYLPSIFKNKN